MSRYLDNEVGRNAVTIANAAGALPAPAAGAALIGGLANAFNDASGRGRSVPELDLEIRSSAGETFTDLQLNSGSLAAIGSVADDTFTAATNDVITETAHGLRSGDGPFTVSSDDTLPAGLTAGVDYYAGVIDANTYKLYTTRSAALLVGTAVDVTDTGTGNHTRAKSASTQRLFWDRVGLLGAAGDGAVVITAERGHRQSIAHSPHIDAYSLETTDLISGAVTAKLRAIVDKE